MTFGCERVRQVRDAGIDALLEAHWREIAQYPDITLSPNWDAYLAAEDYGCLRIYTARLDGALVGYAVYFVKANLHYRGCLQAVTDVLFVHPDHRKGRVGLNLIRYADEQLAAEHVQVVSQHVKLAHPQLGNLLAHLGYVAGETIFFKRLDKRN